MSVSRHDYEQILRKQSKGALTVFIDVSGWRQFLVASDECELAKLAGRPVRGVLALIQLLSVIDLPMVLLSALLAIPAFGWWSLAVTPLTLVLGLIYKSKASLGRQRLGLVLAGFIVAVGLALLQPSWSIWIRVYIFIVASAFLSIRLLYVVTARFVFGLIHTSYEFFERFYLQPDGAVFPFIWTDPEYVHHGSEAAQRRREEEGDAQAQFNLGEEHVEGRSVHGDDAQAVARYRKAAEQGDADAQFNLGLAYSEGRGVRKNAPRAMQWFRKAAEQGDARAQCAAGFRYAKGKGVRQDEAQAAIWYRKAAEQGHLVAQCNVAACYSEGLGVPRDDAEAAFWLRKAAEQGDAQAQFNLAKCYVFGRGLPQDLGQAIFWCRRAAEQGSVVAQFTLGDSYARGQGVAQDYVEAFKWLSLAAVGTPIGEFEASEALKTEVSTAFVRVGMVLTPGQRAKAEKQARAWTVAFDRRRK